MAYYVNNEVLRQTIAKYNANNIYDKFEWIPPYVRKMTNAYQKGKLTKEEYDDTMQFIKKKIDTRNKVLDEYKKMDAQARVVFNDDLNRTREELCGYFRKISVGRANTLAIYKKVPDYEEVKDILTDTLIDMMDKCSRYDTDRGTSCFSYMTTTAENAIKQGINRYKERKARFVSGLDYFDNLDSPDYDYDDLD